MFCLLSRLNVVCSNRRPCLYYSLPLFCDWPSCVSALYLLYSFSVSFYFLMVFSVYLLVKSLSCFQPTYFCSPFTSSSLPSTANCSFLRVFITPASLTPHPVVVIYSIRSVSSF